MDNENRTERGKRYLERQRKELDKQREEIMKQIRERKEQSRISIQKEMRTTSTPKTMATEKQIHTGGAMNILSPVMSDSKKQQSLTKMSLHPNAKDDVDERHSQDLGSLESASIAHTDTSMASFGVARLLEDIDKYKQENKCHDPDVIQKQKTLEQTTVASVTQPTVALNTDKQTKTTTLMSERQTNVSQIQGQIDAQTDNKTQSGVVPQSHITGRDTTNVSTYVVPDSDHKVDTEHVGTVDQLPHVSVVHTGHLGHVLPQSTTQVSEMHTEHFGHVIPQGATYMPEVHMPEVHIEHPGLGHLQGSTQVKPSEDKSLTHGLSGTDTDINAQSLIYSEPRQTLQKQTRDGRSEVKQLSGMAHYIEDMTQISMTNNNDPYKRHIQEQSDKTDTQTDKTKIKEKDDYTQFIKKGKQMLQEITERMEQKSNDSVTETETEEESEMMKRIQKLQLQARMLDEENQRKAEEAKQMADRMNKIKLEEEKLEKERKKLQRLSLLKAKEEMMEREIQLKIKKQMAEDQYLKQLKEKEKCMELSLLQKRQAIHDSIKQESFGNVSPHRHYDRQIRPEDHRLEQTDRIKTELISEERHVSQIERQSEEIYERSTEDLERELGRIAYLNEQLWREQQEIDRKENEKLQQVLLRQRESANRGIELAQKDRYIRQLEEALHNKTEAMKEQSAIDKKEMERLELEQIRDRESAQRENALLEKDRYIKQLEEELNNRTHVTKEVKVEKSKEELLNEREAYLKHYEEELIKKENEIRKKVDLAPLEHSQSQVENKDKKSKEQTPHKEVAQAAGVTSLVKPYLARFSGTDPLPKSEASFEQWSAEVDCLENNSAYPDYAVNMMVRNSLSGQARKVVFTLGPGATTGQIRQKLESVFGNVSTDETFCGSSILHPRTREKV